jgi:integrase
MRSKGEGTVQYRASTKTWFAKVPVAHYPNGKTRFKQVSAPTKSAANKKRMELLSQRDQGMRLTQSSKTFREYAEWHYGVEMAERNRPSSNGNALHLLNRHVFPVFGARKLDEITRQEVLTFLVDKRKQYAASSVNLMKSSISGVYRSAILNDLVDLNPCRDITKFHRTRDDKVNTFEAWTPEEAQAALRAARGTPYETFLVVLLHTGMRLGECLGLHWGDVDFDEGTCHVQRTLRESTRILPDGTGRSDATYHDPKTKQGNRIVPLAPAVIERLKEHRTEQQLLRERWPEWRETDCIFTDALGSELWPSNFGGRYRSWLKKQGGVRYIRIHDIRHTFAHLAAANGISFEAIQDVLGHSSPTITKMIYGSGIIVLQREAVETVESLLRADPGPHLQSQLARL